jgi:hypothetical protein
LSVLNTTFWPGAKALRAPVLDKGIVSAEAAAAMISGTSPIRVLLHTPIEYLYIFVLTFRMAVGDGITLMRRRAAHLGTRKS